MCEAVFFFSRKIYERGVGKNVKERGRESERKRENGERFLFLFLKIRNML